MTLPNVFEPAEAARFLDQSGTSPSSLWHQIVSRSVQMARYCAPPLSERNGLTPAQWDSWVRDGVLILPGHFGAAPLQRLNQYVETHWDRAQKSPVQTVVDTNIGSPNYKRQRMRDVPREALSKPHKIMDLFLETALVREISLERRLTRYLHSLLGEAPLLINTLNLPFGSEQLLHTDSLYMPAPVGNGMLATWVALEDVSAEAGPLRYVPGSHLIPPYRFSTGRTNEVPEEMQRYHDYMRSEVRNRRLDTVDFLPARGDVLIWHGQLYHGGAPILNPNLTRKSLVSHYWRVVDIQEAHHLLGAHAPGRYFSRRQPQTVN